VGGLIQVLALVAIGIAPALAQPAARFAIEDVDRWIERLHASRGFSGAVVIERDGHVVYSRGVGVANDETRRMFTPDTRTDGGSLAKPFTATLLLMLAEEGAVDLQAPVRRYVNEYPDATTTVYQLLSHQAALPDYDAFGALFRAGKPVTTASMLTEAGRMATLASHAGATRFAYCNLCFDTAALVVERVTGKRFDQVLRQQLFASLGIEHAFIRPARLASMPPDRAIGYRILDGRRERFDAEDLEGFYGGSNLYAPARDFARFARAFAVPANAPRPVLPARALWPLVPPGNLPSGLTLGSWYCATGGERCYYTGAHRGFYNVMYWDRAKRLVVVYVSNSTIAAWLQPQITRQLVAAAEGRSLALPVEPQLVTLTPESLHAATGTYDVPGAGRVTLFEDQDKPYIRAGTGTEYRLYRVSPTLLYGPGLDAYIGIASDGRLSWTTVFVEALGTRAPS
jgi:CubicO group peptidase (beta-lactamase class C family)